MAIRLRGRRAECEFLDAVLRDALGGRSRSVVLRGEAGVGKSSLLEYVAERAAGWHVSRASGVESEVELAFSGLHQLCSPFLHRLDRLPEPQRRALSVVFGHDAGPAPDRFLVGLAVLTLLDGVADEQPLLCLVDDAQWLDDVSAQIIGFIGRRLLAERIALVCVARSGAGDGVLTGLPSLTVSGLGDSDARALLLENLPGPLDAAVFEQLLSESRGNPLAVLELPRSWRLTEVAGGFAFPVRRSVTGRIAQSYAARLAGLPVDTQILVLAAAAEPLGDSALLHRALEHLGIDPAAAAPAVDAGLLDLSGRVRFTHPLVRSAAYGDASEDLRRRVHRALADASDAGHDADRRAWHRARGTDAPDEEVAAELVRSAGRAQARGGSAAAAAFLDRAAALTPDPGIRARRSLLAAEAEHLAGAPEAASRLLVAATDGPLDARDRALAGRIRGEVALGLWRAREAVTSLIDAADGLAATDPELSRATSLEALRAASISGRLDTESLRRAADAARRAPRAPDAGPIDLLLDGLAARVIEGYASSAPTLKRALHAIREEGRRPDLDVRWPWYSRRVALDLFDAETARVFATGSVRRARDRGALGVLPLALGSLASVHLLDGRLTSAEAVLDESDAITTAIGESRIGSTRLLLHALHADEPALARVADAAVAEATARGEGIVITFNEHAHAVLYNGLGRYELALPPAQSAALRDELDASVRALPELVEAAARTGATDLAVDAVVQLTERTRAAGTEWALGIEARARALVAPDAEAERFYVEAIDRLGRAGIRLELARGHLLYGEWLRRLGRRVDARDQLRRAYDMLAQMGVAGFAERARRELAATGEKVRRRQAENHDELTPQERQIAQMARDGRSNPEIAAQLFLSSRTVEWHLRKVFAKLGVSSRRELDATLPEDALA